LIETLEKRVKTGGYELLELGNRRVSTVSAMLGFERETFKYSEKPEVPYLRVHNIKPFFIDFKHDLVYISYDVHKKMTRSSLQPDDVVMTTTGTVGVAAVVPSDLTECNISQEIVRIRIVNKNLVRPQYLAAYLNRSETKTLLNRWGNGATRPRTLIRNTRKIPILIPKDLKIQDEIVEKVRKVEEIQRAVLTSMTELTESTNKLYKT
jgi:type I restriction enzyme S subunit